MVTYIGFETQKRAISIKDKRQILDFELQPSKFELNRIVVTGTKTFKRQTESSVIVNVLGSDDLDNVQACNLSEGLKFQPGLRVETDCQTCNYTQLRMNGLAGGYSQILINGRPIFSPLTGLYGLEQIPTNMIERIEVVRGAGSALYGSSAIGGTVNVLTKIPKKSAFDVEYNYQNIDGVSDHIFSGNASVLNESKTAGLSVFVNNRNREWYDNNDDNFSEIPIIRNNSFGANLFLQPSQNQKLEFSLSSLNEYRYGGEMLEKPAHLVQQSEERTTNVLVGSVDYQINFNDERASFISYLAGQITDRTHFTGIFPDEPTDIQSYIENPPYGTSDNYTYQGGLQLNYQLDNFLGGRNVLTFGTEYVVDDVLDVIEAYNYEVDQLTKNFGVFLQSDWEISRTLNLLAGIRADQHNFVDNLVLNPRLSLLYKPFLNTQFRASWGTGFRAPQAFDADLHIAFAGGGISRISLDDDLISERSNSFSASVNYDKIKENFIAGFTIEGFYTNLDHAFFLQTIGQDAFGERFEKQNGEGSTVQGVSVEMRANYKRKMQLEAGFTIQSSLFDSPVENVEGLPALRQFLRTPNEYGFATFTFFPNKKWNSSINIVYTGSMEIAHFAGAPELAEDEYFTSPTFTEISFKTGYTFDMKTLNTGLELFGGVKNITNAYQDNFDTGKNRDSNFVFGPSAPRTLFIGLRLRSF